MSWEINSPGSDPRRERNDWHTKDSVRGNHERRNNIYSFPCASYDRSALVYWCWTISLVPAVFYRISIANMISNHLVFVNRNKKWETTRFPEGTHTCSEPYRSPPSGRATPLRKNETSAASVVMT